jgi:hypothetical protein
MIMVVVIMVMMVTSGNMNDGDDETMTSGTFHNGNAILVSHYSSQKLCVPKITYGHVHALKLGSIFTD